MINKIFIACPISKYINGKEFTNNDFKLFIEKLYTLCQEFVPNVFLALRREEFGKKYRCGGCVRGISYPKNPSLQRGKGLLGLSHCRIHPQAKDRACLPFSKRNRRVGQSDCLPCGFLRLRSLFPHFPRNQRGYRNGIPKKIPFQILTRIVMPTKNRSE